MNFEQRNEAWTGQPPRKFLQTQTRSSSPRVWRCWVMDNVVFYQWGQEGGAIQTANEYGQVVNKGKKNEVSARDNALYLARDKCRKQHWSGYREVDEKNEALDDHETKIDFSNPPLNLAFWKPDNSPGAGITKKAEAKQVVYARKMNGLMYVAWSSGEGKVFLTSRRMLRQHDDEQGSPYTWDDRFPHIITALQGIMPPKSCVLGELCAFDGENKESLALISSYTKSLTPRALEDQAKNGWAWYYIWDIAFWDGQDLVSEAPAQTRHDLIKTVFGGGSPFIPVQLITPESGNFYGPPDYMRDMAKAWGWEGFVMVDPQGVFGDRAYNFKGKPDRPGKFAAKVKPEFEDDFIVYWDPEKGYGEYSTKGRYGGKGMKSATLWQYNQKGELTYIANVASGLTEEMKTNALPSLFPQVWQVLYSSRRYVSDGDDTNALDFPRFNALRTDKKPEECVNPRL